MKLSNLQRAQRREIKKRPVRLDHKTVVYLSPGDTLKDYLNRKAAKND